MEKIILDKIFSKADPITLIALCLVSLIGLFGFIKPLEHKIDNQSLLIQKIEQDDLTHIRMTQLEISIYSGLESHRDKQFLSSQFQEYNTLRQKVGEAENLHLTIKVNEYLKN